MWLLCNERAAMEWASARSTVSAVAGRKPQAEAVVSIVFHGLYKSDPLIATMVLGALMCTWKHEDWQSVLWQCHVEAGPGSDELMQVRAKVVAVVLFMNECAVKLKREEEARAQAAIFCSPEESMMTERVGLELGNMLAFLCANLDSGVGAAKEGLRETMDIGVCSGLLAAAWLVLAASSARVKSCGDVCVTRECLDPKEVTSFGKLVDQLCVTPMEGTRCPGQGVLDAAKLWCAQDGLKTCTQLWGLFGFVVAGKVEEDIQCDVVGHLARVAGVLRGPAALCLLLKLLVRTAIGAWVVNTQVRPGLGLGFVDEEATDYVVSAGAVFRRLQLVAECMKSRSWDFSVKPSEGSRWARILCPGIHSWGVSLKCANNLCSAALLLVQGLMPERRYTFERGVKAANEVSVIACVSAPRCTRTVCAHPMCARCAHTPCAHGVCVRCV